MSTLTILALVALPIIGAIAAWVGDVIGYRLGRSRRRLFGLRPRTTARLVGMSVGALLPLIGLAFAAAGSEQVRIALLHLEELRANNRRLAEENRRLEASRNVLSERVKRLEQLESQARQRYTEAEQRAERATLAAQAAQESLQRTRGRLAMVRRSFAKVRERLKKLSAERDKLEADVRKLTEESQRLTHALAVARQRAEQVERQRKEVERKLQAAQEELNKLQQQQARLKSERDRLVAERKELESLIQDLNRQREQLTRDFEKAQRAYNAVQEALQENTRKLDRAESRLQAAEAYLEALTRRYAAWIEQERMIEESPVVFQPGDELVRASISAEQSRDQLEAALAELLVLANNAAIRERVPPDKNGKAIILVRPLPLHAAPGTTPSEEDIIRDVASRILESGEKRFVVAVRSLERHFLLEPRQLHVELKFAPDKIRFHKGEVIGRLRVEPPVEQADVLRRILAMRRHLRDTAIARGLWPDPKTGEYGGILTEDIVRIVPQVAKSRKPVEILLVVKDDVPTAKPLLVRLEVRPVNE